MNLITSLPAALTAAAWRRLRRTQGTVTDLYRHLRGRPCQRPVLAHPFVSGGQLGFSPERCVFLASEDDDWCTRPRRCHFIPGSTAWRILDAKTGAGRAFTSGCRGETGA